MKLISDVRNLFEAVLRIIVISAIVSVDSAKFRFGPYETAADGRGFRTGRGFHAGRGFSFLTLTQFVDESLR